MSGLKFSTAYGELIIGGISMHCPAWNVIDPRPLWLPGLLRGENLVVPGATGRRHLNKKLDERRVSLPMVLTGDADRTGSPACGDDPVAQMQLNMDFLVANVLTPTGGTRAGQLVMPSGPTRTATLEVGLTEGFASAHAWNLTLDLVILEGRFA